MNNRSVVLMAALAAALLSSAVRAQEKGVHVCGTPVGPLRLAPGAACRAGEIGYLLAEAEGDLSSPDEEKKDEKELRELRDKIKSLTDRVAELEKDERRSPSSGNAASSRVFAPFEVLDKQGNAILRVSDVPFNQEPGLAARVLIAPGSSKNYSVRMRSSSGKDAVGVGTTAEGMGAILVYGSDAVQPRSIMSVEGFQIFSADKREAAVLTSGPAGGGQLVLSRHGATMMEAGSTNEGRGVVRVGPNFTCTGSRLANGMGAPDCIMGRLPK